MAANFKDTKSEGNGYSAENSPIIDHVVNQSEIISISDLEMHGYETAGQYVGDEFVYQTSLNKILQGVIAREDQIERRKNISDEVAHHDVEIQSQKDQIEQNTKKIAPIDEEIETIEAEKTKAVDTYVNPNEDLIYYNISRVILSLLTVYLVIFYTSIIYGAFIWDILKEISAGTGIKGLHLPTIVNLKAIPDTWNEFGILGVLFLFSSTSLFITLGFLYAKWNKDNDQLKKIGILSFTLLFDVLMAYEIVEKIHLLKYNMGMETKEWVPTMVFTNINFWIIICAGFAAYIIWGFVFEFLMEEREKLNPLARVLEKFKLRIEFHRDRINTIKDKIDGIKSEILRLERGKSHKINQMKSIVYDRRTLEKNIDEFTNGWIRYLSGLSDEAAESKKQSINQVKGTFLQNLLSSPKSIQSATE